MSKVTIFWLKYKFNFIDADHRYWNQCVDLIRQYCKEVLNYTMPPLDKARNLTQKQLTQNKFKEVIVWKEKLRKWDIVSVDLIPQNKYWHIFIIYRQTKDWYYYIDQNGIGWAGNQKKDWTYPKIKGNGVEKRFAKWGRFKILKVFRYIT